MPDKNLDLTNIPWVDSHIQPQSLTWNDAEDFAIGGARGLVMTAGNCHWSPYRPVRAADVQWLWDLAIKWSSHLERAHFYKVRVAVAIHTLARVVETDKLLKMLPEYLKKDKVVALGETGIEVTHYTSQWPLEEQAVVLKEQFKIAKQLDMPIIVHTPVQKLYSQGWDEYLQSPLIKFPEAKLEATKRSLDLLREAGVEETKVIIDHADTSISDMVLENHKCYLGFSIGCPWRKLSLEDVASVIKKYGADRIIINSSLVGNMYGDAFAMSRAILDLKRFGISKEGIKQVVFDNPNGIYGGIFSEPI